MSRRVASAEMGVLRRKAEAGRGPRGARATGARPNVVARRTRTIQQARKMNS